MGKGYETFHKYVAPLESKAIERLDDVRREEFASKFFELAATKEGHLNLLFESPGESIEEMKRKHNGKSILSSILAMSIRSVESRVELEKIIIPIFQVAAMLTEIGYNYQKKELVDTREG